MESTPVAVINDYDKGGLMMTESMKDRPAFVCIPLFNRESAQQN